MKFDFKFDFIFEVFIHISMAKGGMPIHNGGEVTISVNALADVEAKAMSNWSVAFEGTAPDSRVTDEVSSSGNLVAVHNEESPITLVGSAVKGSIAIAEV